MCWYLFSFSWLEMCVPSDMITGLFSFSCTLYVVCACLSVSCLAQEALPTAVPKLIMLHRFLRRACHLFRWIGLFQLELYRCELPRVVACPVTVMLAGSRRGRGGVRAGCAAWGSGKGRPVFSREGQLVRGQKTQVCAGSSVCQIPPSEKDLCKTLRLSLLPLTSLGLCPGVKCYVILY